MAVKPSCDGCGAKAVTKIYPMRMKGDDMLSPATGTKALCGLCASTFVGNHVEYPDHYSEDLKAITRHVNYVGNHIMNEIEKLREELRRSKQ